MSEYYRVIRAIIRMNVNIHEISGLSGLSGLCVYIHEDDEDIDDLYTETEILEIIN